MSSAQQPLTGDPDEHPSFEVEPRANNPKLSDLDAEEKAGASCSVCSHLPCICQGPAAQPVTPGGTAPAYTSAMDDLSMHASTASTTTMTANAEEHELATIL